MSNPATRSLSLGEDWTESVEKMEYQSTDHPAGDAQQADAVVARLNPVTTLVVGLAVGMLAGFFGRPLVTPRPLNDPAVVAPGEAPGQAVLPAGVMEAVVTQTRHFNGDARAPVTIIEFGDFQ